MKTEAHFPKKNKEKSVLSLHSNAFKVLKSIMLISTRMLEAQPQTSLCVSYVQGMMLEPRNLPQPPNFYLLNLNFLKIVGIVVQTVIHHTFI